MPVITAFDTLPFTAAGLAQLGERQTEVHFIILSEGHVFDPHKPQASSFAAFCHHYPREQTLGRRGARCFDITSLSVWSVALSFSFHLSFVLHIDAR